MSYVSYPDTDPDINTPANTDSYAYSDTYPDIGLHIGEPRMAELRQLVGEDLWRLPAL